MTVPKRRDKLPRARMVTRVQVKIRKLISQRSASTPLKMEAKSYLRKSMTRSTTVPFLIFTIYWDPNMRAVGKKSRSNLVRCKIRVI